MRRRLIALVLAFASIGTIGASAAKAATDSPNRPWLCVGEKDIQKSVCLYPPVPDPPSSTAR